MRYGKTRMSDQLTIRLPEDLSQALEAASIRLRRTRSDIVRLALYRFVDFAPIDGGTPSSRVQHLMGALDTGVPDLAENHRAYILDLSSTEGKGDGLALKRA